MEGKDVETPRLKYEIAGGALTIVVTGQRQMQGQNLKRS